MEALILRENQEEVLQYMLDSPTNSALVAGAGGFGKTVVSVEYIKAVNAQQVLVIAPKNTFTSEEENWRPTVKRQGLELPQYVIASTNSNWEKLRQGEAGIYYINREFFGLSGTASVPKMNKTTGQLSKGRPIRYDWTKVKPDVVVFDEIHAAQNRKSNIAEVLKKLKTAHKIGLSATPAGDKFQGLWSITRWLFPEQIDRSFWRWAAQWAVVANDPFAGKVVKEELEAGEFVRSLPCYVYVASDLPDENRIEVLVDMTTKQHDQYQQALKEEVVWFEENPLIIEYPIVRRTRLKQMTLGTISIDSDDLRVHFDDSTESAKLNWVVQFIKEHPEKNILLVTSSNSFSEVVARRLGDSARAWNGNTTSEQRVQIIREFGKSVKYVVAQHKAIAEGVDGLQHYSNTMIAFDESSYNTMNKQVIWRLNRPPQPHIVDYYVLLAKNSIDTTEVKTLLRKAAAISASTRV